MGDGCLTECVPENGSPSEVRRRRDKKIRRNGIRTGADGFSSDPIRG